MLIINKFQTTTVIIYKSSFAYDEEIVYEYKLVNDISLKGITKDETGRGTFIFAKTSQSQKLLQNFSQLKARVEPMAFVLAQKKLKQLLYLPNST